MRKSIGLKAQVLESGRIPQANLAQATVGGAPPMTPPLKELLDTLQQKEGDKPPLA